MRTNNSYLHQNLCAEKEIPMEYQNKIGKYLIANEGEELKYLPTRYIHTHKMLSTGLFK